MASLSVTRSNDFAVKFAMTLAGAVFLLMMILGLLMLAGQGALIDLDPAFFYQIMTAHGAGMVGTAGLPHVIVRFYTVRKVAAARISAGWALLFIALLYTTAPAVAAFARTNLLTTVSSTP